MGTSVKGSLAAYTIYCESHSITVQVTAASWLGQLKVAWVLFKMFIRAAAQLGLWPFL